MHMYDEQISTNVKVTGMYQKFLAKHDPAYVARKREALIRHEEACSSEIKPIVYI